MQENKEKNIPAVSVIMPVYNGERTLEASLRSVLNQTLNDMEIIVVDDGSKDRTVTILRALKKEDSRISMVKTDRAGPALARNAGLKRATGQYIFFMDADDWIAPDSISMMLKTARKNQAQVAIFGFIRTTEKGKTEYRFPDALLNGKRRLAEYLPELYRSGLLNPAWNKLYERGLLTRMGICFPDLPYGEDRMFVFDVLYAADRIVIDHRFCYEYRAQQGGSLVSRYLPEKFEICGRLDDRVRELAEQCGGMDEQGQKVFSYMYLKSVLSCVSVLFSPSCPLKIKEKYYKVKKMVKHPYVRAQIRFSGGNGAMFSLSCLILRTGFVLPSMLLGWGIAKTERCFPRLFLKAKQ